MADPEKTETEEEEETTTDEEEESQETSESTGGSEEESSDDVEALKKEITKLRKENARRRTDSRAAKQAKDDTEGRLKAIAKALGVEDGDEPDVDALKAQLDKASGEMKSLKIENALSRAAKKHGADPEALTDSRSFMKDANVLNPDDEDFASSLNELVKTAVENNPKLKAGQASTRSGGEFGPSDDGKKVSLDAAIAKGDGDEINRAFDAELEAGRK